MEVEVKDTKLTIEDNYAALVLAIQELTNSINKLVRKR
jgi:hypothetical protein